MKRGRMERSSSAVCQPSKMASLKFTLVFVLCLVALMAPMASAQCGAKSNSRCATWKQIGFCTSSFFNLAFRQAQCGIECGLCPAGGK